MKRTTELLSVLNDTFRMNFLSRKLQHKTKKDDS